MVADSEYSKSAHVVADQKEMNELHSKFAEFLPMSNVKQSLLNRVGSVNETLVSVDDVPF